MDNDLGEIKAILKKYSQEHLLNGYDKLDEAYKKKLLEEISEIDFELIKSLYEKTKKEPEVIKSDEMVKKEELVKKEQEYDELMDRYKRVLAEFENYKKRSAKERDQLYNSIMGDIMTGILPVLDNLEKAVQAETKDTGYKQGVELVYKQLQDLLKANGVEEIEAVGKTFDPELHEAVSSVVDENLGEKEIKEDYRKGYKIGDRVIRHSMVVVAN